MRKKEKLKNVVLGTLCIAIGIMLCIVFKSEDCSGAFLAILVGIGMCLS